jgi:hypothetical protein
MSNSLPLNKALRKGLLRASALAAVAVFAGTAFAADHRDGPAVQVAADVAGDINDVYAFMDSGKLILGMTVSPFADANASFSDAIVYQFHVDKRPGFLEPSAGTTDVMCTFNAAQDFQCWVEDVDYVTGPSGVETGTTSESGDLRVFAGLRADPFYFFLTGAGGTTGFAGARAAVIAAAPGLTFNSDGCPIITAQIGATLRGLLTAAGPADNTFATANGLAIVIEADPALFIDVDNPFVTVWASTNRLGN